MNRTFDPGLGLSVICDQINTGGNVWAAIKAPVKAATTANISLTGRQTIDGIALIDGDRVLVKDQTLSYQNGIYLVSTFGSWGRAPDWDDSFDVLKGTLVPVAAGGTTNGGLHYAVTTADPIAVGTTNVTLAVAFSAAASTFLPSGTGAVSTDLQSRGRYVVYVADFLSASQKADVRARTLLVDVTLAYQAALDATPDGGVLVHIPGAYSVTGALTRTTAISLVCQSGTGRYGSADTNIKPGARIVLSANAATLITFGQLETSTANMSGPYLVDGVAFDGATKTLSDALVVLQGVTRPSFNRSAINRSTGTALRMRECFEPTFTQTDIMNNDASGTTSGVIVVDDVYNSNTLLNVNNVVFTENCIIEGNKGPIFWAHQTSNLSGLKVYGNKFEWGLASIPASGPWSIFEIRNGFVIDIFDNNFTNFNAANKYDTLYEMGYTSGGTDYTCGFSIHDNQYATVDVNTIELATLGNARGMCKDNNCVSSSNIIPKFSIAGTGWVRAESATSQDTGRTSIGGDVSKWNNPLAMRGGAAGWGFIPAQNIAIAYAPSATQGFEADANAKNAFASSFQSSAAAAVLGELPLGLLAGYPSGIRVGIRCRSATGAGTINLRVNTSTFTEATLASTYAVIWYDIPQDYLRVLGDNASDRLFIQTGAANAEKVYLDGVYVVPTLNSKYVDTTGVGNVGAGTDTLITYSLRANSLNTNTQGVRITAWGTKANNANAKTVALLFGTTTICTKALATAAAGNWRIVAEVLRTGASAQDYNAFMVGDDTSSGVGTATETDTAAIVIKCTGTATSDNDIKQEGLIVEKIN